MKFVVELERKVSEAEAGGRPICRQRGWNNEKRERKKLLKKTKSDVADNSGGEELQVGGGCRFVGALQTSG